MSNGCSITTEFCSHVIEISFADDDSPSLMSKSTDFLVSAPNGATPNYFVNVNAAGDGLFPSRYTVERATNHIEFRSPDFIGVFDLRNRNANVTIPNSLDLRHHYKGKPLRPLWSILAEMRQVVMMHAALISREGHGVLIVGNSGRGKTTLATRASRKGWTLLSEDMTPVSYAMGTTRGYSLYTSVSLTESEVISQDLTVVPRLVDAERQKRVYHFSDLTDVYVLDYNSVPIRAIIALNGFSSEPTLRECSTADILRQLVPSTILQSSLRSPNLLSEITTMIGSIPSFSLTLGSVHHWNIEQLSSILH